MSSDKFSFELGEGGSGYSWATMDRGPSTISGPRWMWKLFIERNTVNKFLFPTILPANCDDFLLVLAVKNVIAWPVQIRIREQSLRFFESFLLKRAVSPIPNIFPEFGEDSAREGSEVYPGWRRILLQEPFLRLNSSFFVFENF